MTAIAFAIERNGDQVRLITRGGYVWTRRYPYVATCAHGGRIRRSRELALRQELRCHQPLE